MNILHSPSAALAVKPIDDLVRERPEPRRRAAARRFLSAMDLGGTALLLFVGTTLLSALVIFGAALAITGAIEAARWALSTSAGFDLHVLSLVEFSAVGGLILAAMGCTVFASDLRRQRWL